MKKQILFFVTALMIYSCKTKKKENFFPVLSFIKSQIAHVDTSFYPIEKITWLDSTHADTAYVKREEFKSLAKDFLEIPDLSEKKLSRLYAEEKFYDEGLNRVILSYKPKNPDTASVQQQEVLITPDPSGDKVKSIIINMNITNKDSSIQKRMLWKVDQSFQVATIVQKSGQPETTSVMKVTWNEKGNE